MNTTALMPLKIEVSGIVTSSNFDEWKDKAIAIIQDIPATFVTDEDFAEADNNAKWLKDIERQLKDAKDQAIANTDAINALYTAVDYMADVIRNKRLILEKAVTQEKEKKRNEIAHQAAEEIFKYAKDLNKTLPTGVHMTWAPALHFQQTMKNRRTLDGCLQAVDAAIREEKNRLIDTHQIIMRNADAMAGKEYLVKDFKAHCLKHHADFLELLQLREAEEAVRLEKEQLRQAQQQANAKAEAEAEAKRKESEELGRDLQAKQPDPPSLGTIALTTIARLNREAREKAEAEAKAAAEVATAPAVATAPTISDAALTSARMIAAFMRTQDFGADKWKIRAVLIDYEKFRAEQIPSESEQAA